MTGVSLEAKRLTIDYTDKDFISLVNALRGYIQTFFPELTDFNASSGVQMMIELFASVGDRLAFSQDKQANETNIVTARRRRNVIRLALTIGYTPSTATASEGTIQATLTAGAIANDVIIPKGTIISTEDESEPKEFQTLNDIVITAGQTVNSGSIKNSVSYTQSFESNGDQNQKYKVTNSPFLDDGSAIATVNTEEWEQVENFLDSGSTDKHFTIEVDEEDKGTFIFGDGVNGAIPAPGDDIEFEYQTGGGESGNQLANTIVSNQDVFTDTSSNIVRIAFTNTSATTGGSDRESVEEIRIRAPRALKTLTRTIAREDFTINPEDGVPGVARSIAFSSAQDATLPDYHGFVYIVPEDGYDDPPGSGIPTTALKEAVRNYLTVDKPIPLGMDLDVLNADYQTVQVKGQIYIDPDRDFVTVKNLILDNIRTFFAFDTFEDNKVDRTIDFGKEIVFSKVHKQANSVFGVTKISNFMLVDVDGVGDLGTGIDLPLDTDKKFPLLDDSNFDTPYSSGGLEFIQG